MTNLQTLSMKTIIIKIFARKSSLIIIPTLYEILFLHTYLLKFFQEIWIFEFLAKSNFPLL
ncbi:hypothetical protein HMPREF1987_01538 [Peptostreptococcaceae bacterium oral taxon 113 str. W5053]|nr:hypothetical protein HMPREF1987_01538 [Peptostreptococcaceae bacterium oral taxon 113 str. W5053]